MSDITSLQTAISLDTILPLQTISANFTVTTSGTLGTISNLGSATGNLITDPTQVTTGKFNFICIGYDTTGNKLLLADRVVQTNVALSERSFSGVSSSLGSTNVYLRWPTISLYTQAIVSSLGSLSANDSIWNASIKTWCIDIPTASTDGVLANIMGGATPDTLDSIVYTTISPILGYRPLIAVKPTIVPRGKVGTTIPLVTSILDMVPGKAISCEYTATTSGAIGTFANIGAATKDNLPDIPAATADGTFYFICIGYTPQGYPICYADRNVQNNVAANNIDSAMFSAYGKTTSISGTSVRLRLPNTIPEMYISPATDVCGEWDYAITKNTSAGNTNDIWNTKYSQSLTMVFQKYVMADKSVQNDGTIVLVRGYQDEHSTIENQQQIVTTVAVDRVGFRPVMIIPSSGVTRGKAGCGVDIFSIIPGSSNKLSPGFAVSCEYTASAGTFGQFNNFGAATKPNITAEGEPAPDGTFYFICVGYTPNGGIKLVADRNIQNNISYTTLSAAGVCVSSGLDINISGLGKAKMRLPETLSSHYLTTELGEWDSIITKLSNSKITSPGAKEVWNAAYCKSWTMVPVDTIDDAKTLNTGNYFIARGEQDVNYIPNKQSIFDVSFVSNAVGFRPVILLPNTVNTSGKYISYCKNNIMYGYTSWY